MGAPGAGKGTQAVGVAQHFGVPAISTGSIFRDNVARKTALGQQVEAIMAAGEFVPDELTEQLVADRLSQPDAADGWLLDGFPRTLHQVSALSDYLAARGQQLDAAIALEVPEALLTERLLNRAQIEGRADDNEEAIRRRFEMYQQETEPLLAEYDRQGLVLRVDGVGTLDEVRDRISEALAEKNQG